MHTENIVIATCIVLSGVVGLLCGSAITQDNIRQEAIKAGVAEYILVSPESAKTEFRWKTAK